MTANVMNTFRNESHRIYPRGKPLSETGKIFSLESMETGP